MKKSSLLALPLTATLLLPLLASAQTPVFRCEVDGRVTWSDRPCKGNSKVVKVKPLKSGVPNNTNGKAK
ncbi:DUF4124 domain-containing protein [Undibacterium sp.]|uniref:DUF4124 domain-containing protein n=1 Tax=Undibacterium sp. TaxID=1914977 RepID=UPI0027308ED0|nr:DUF4124 domain-containing protein [Undibacterium sp.]MDP1980053.1 hypothetical protein [Undibacterium sp.]